MLTGAIEAGGTKFVCGVGDPHGSRETARFPTGDVAATLAAVVAFFRAAEARHGPVAAFGIGSFGPLQLDPTAADYGRITTTPKPGWAGADIPAALRAAFAVPVAIDTDVNTAALAEATHGAGAGVSSLAYVTVGTGIGVGLAIDGRTVRGLGHPEAGHLLPRRHPDHGDFAGICPYHGDCLEGLASGPAIIAAWGASFAELPADHPAWGVQADYLGQLCATLILTAAPAHIVLGGGVLSQQRLIEGTRRRTEARLAGYCADWTGDAFATRITAPGCAEPPGLLGAYMLAEAAALLRTSASPPG
ncbi:MAG: ROK family protein [Sphingomonas sp.]